jgi:hypothetical protein
MSFRTLRCSALVAILILTTTGCGLFQSGKNDADAEIAELDDIDAPKANIKPVENEQVEKTPPPVVPQTGVLELKLTENEPFPLSKTVEQRLTETDSAGNVSVSQSRTDMLLSLNVDSTHPDGRKRMTVRFHRVYYEEDIRGVRSVYSSEKPGETIPRNCLLYAGLVDNSFSFFVGPNNKVAELVDFKDFLQRCLRKVPPQDVANVRQQLEATVRSEDGISTFIDDSIGLLPYSNDPAHPGVEVREGSHWELKRYTENPIPTFTTTTCTLNELSRNSAEIGLTGTISGPPNPITRRSPGGEIKVLVKGGYCTGSCRLDRRTGLPTQSLVQRSLQLAMELPNGQKIEQNKETVSSVTSFLVTHQQAGAKPDSHIQQTNLQQAAGPENHR